MSPRTPLLFLFFLTFSSTSQATVPASSQFKFVNEGEFGDYIVEYDANYRVLKPFNNPFQLCFYNTTPGAYTFALRMGTVRSESLMRWVWEANRGNPVHENATLTFGSDGNLVLAEADGKIVWQTATANKGVVGFQLLSNGNMVLHDSAGNYIWQSFDHPTDTLLVSQSLRARGPTTLVSRLSAVQNKNGPYSIVLEPKRLAFYYKSINSPKPMLYFTSSELFSTVRGNLEYVTFSSEETDQGFAYYLLLDYNTTVGSSGGRYFTRPNYNATLSYLRLGVDGNVRFYTYNPNVDIGAWEVTYTLFDRDSSVTECQLPERCGKFGLCDDNQCVACPTPNGLVGWSKACEAPKVASCSTAKDFHYYKLEGVDHFMIKYSRGDGPVKESDCGSKCSRDCKCMAYFYHQLTSRCWIAYDLMTLTHVANSTHLAYIKAPNH